MRRPRSYLPEKLEPGREIDLPREIVRHLVQVLRMKEGQEIILFNGEDGIDYRAELVTAGKRQARARVLAAGDPEPPPDLKIHLALGISRGERMDLALQKAVELGVSAITPLILEHSQKKLSPERLEKKQRHWRKIVISACEQSGRRRLPVLHAPASLEDWLERRPPRTLLLDPRAPQCLRELPRPEHELGLLVGPEGGFSERERIRAQTADCTGVRLGPRILRTETAPLAAIAAIQVLWGDFC